MKKLSDPSLFSSVIELAEQISAMSTTHELTAAMWRFNDILGVSGSVFTSFAREDDSRESYKFINACPAAWCQEYNANAWFTIDPCLLYSMTHNEPTLIQHIPLKSRGQRNMMDAANRCGFVSGIVVPAHSPSGRSRMGVLYLGSDQAEYLDETALKHLRLVLRAVSNELLDWWTKKVRMELLVATQLTSDEKGMLLFTLDGLGSKEIAVHLGATKNAIDQRMHRIVSRFNTQSRKDAANIALQYGLLS